MKKPQQHFRIPQPGRLLQKYQSIHHRKIRAGDPRPPTLELPVQRRPCRRNLLQQLRADAMDSAHVAEVDAHPVRCVRDFRIVHIKAGADLSRRCFVLCLPGESVVVTPVPEVQKATHRHLEIQRRVQRPPRRNRQQRLRVRPHLQLFHRGNQRQPVGDVVIAQSAGPVLHVRFEMKDGVAKFMMTRARNFAQVMDQVLTLPPDQTRHNFIVQP